ncbi:hypothetical protein [Streptomyces sp. NPDC047968]|uniref:Uncharacterized protein n=1 Tax=Streptomyces sanyensis TaxID=568869 RepID=A0ABP8ZT62_9ACTN
MGRGALFGTTGAAPDEKGRGGGSDEEVTAQGVSWGYVDGVPGPVQGPGAVVS